MSLDEQLRAVLSEQAELRTPERGPDVDRLVSGGRARRRRRALGRLGAAAVAVGLLGAGATYGAAQLDRERVPVTERPSSTATTGSGGVPPYRDTDQAPFEAGTYRIPVGVGDSGLLAAHVTFEGQGWRASNHPVVFDGPVASGLGVYQVSAVARGSGCHLDDRLVPAASAPGELARQLSLLPRSTVEKPPTRTRAFGTDALHLRVRVDDRCWPSAFYRPVETTVLGAHLGSGRGVSYVDRRSDVIIDFWVFQVDGITVVADMFRNPGTSVDVVLQVRDAVESITFVTE